MATIRNCPSCGKPNQIPGKHISDIGRCGACKAAIPSMTEPLEVNAEEFDEVVRDSKVRGDQPRFEQSPQLREALRQLPAGQRRGLIQRTGLLLEQGQVVQRIEDDRLAFITAPVACDHFTATGDHHFVHVALDPYREGMRNEKVTVNPAGLFSKRRESGGRIRYMSREEYNRVCDAIRRKFPEHLPEFVVSVNTGMRLAEQYSANWSQFDESRRSIDLTQTKNGSARTIHLNADALAAIKSVQRPGQKPSDRIFSREDHKKPSQRKQERFDTRSWFVPCLAEAKIMGYVWHCNRHTFCSWLAMAGTTIKEIQELAGHKTITMSARYAHLSPDHKLSVLDRITGTATENLNSHQNSHQPKTATRRKRAKVA